MDALDLWIGKVLDFALYSRLYYRLKNDLPRLFLVAAPALLALLAFAVLAAQTKDGDGQDTSAVPTIIEHSCDEGCGMEPGSQSAPDFAPVKFQTGRATIDQDGLGAIAVVRDYLRSHPAELCRPPDSRIGDKDFCWAHVLFL